MSELDTLVDLVDTTPATKSMSDSATKSMSDSATKSMSDSANKSLSDSANNMDEFDPFGPSSASIDASNNGNDNDNDNDNLLVDFTVETEEKLKQNGITNNFDVDYEVTMSAENEIQSEGHIYANSEPIADPIYENVGETNGKAEDDVYENVVKETGDNQEISVTIKADINASDINASDINASDGNPTYDIPSDGNPTYDIPSSAKKLVEDEYEDDVVVVTSEDDGTPAPRFDAIQNDEGEIEIEIAPKSPSRSRSNSENRESVSPAERPASPTPDHDRGSSDDEAGNSQTLNQSPVPTPTPRKRTSLSRSKSPELEITKEHSRSPSISSEGRNTRSPSPDDMINQASYTSTKYLVLCKKHRQNNVHLIAQPSGPYKTSSPSKKSTAAAAATTNACSKCALLQKSVRSEEEIIKNGETVSMSREDAVFTETRGDPSLTGTDGCSTETIETSKVTREEVSTDKIHSPIVSDDTEHGGRILPSRSEAGIFENEPAVLEGIAHYTEHQHEDKLPEHGTARNLAARFKEIQDETAKPSVSHKREITPERFSEKAEYISEPRSKTETYEGKSESGIFESQPLVLSEDVVSGYAKSEDQLPEKGSTDHIVQRFKDIQSAPVEKPNQGQRELTPDRTGKSEYVSEPRSTFEEYVGKPESGIFESEPVRDPHVIRPEDDMDEEILPNQGTARNLVAKFKKLQEEQPYIPKKPVDILQTVANPEPAIVESQPISLEGVVKEDDEVDEKLPEKGQTRNLLAKFREIESGGGSQSPSPRSRKEFTPPRDLTSGNSESGIYENTPELGLEFEQPKIEGGIFENVPVSRPDVVKEADRFEERLPEHGTARSLLSKFKRIQSDASVKSPTSPRSMKEFTPPRDELSAQETGLNESGIVENDPQFRPDVLREADTDWNEGMPSKGSAKSVVDKFKCIQEEAKKESAKAMPKKPSKVRR